MLDINYTALCWGVVAMLFINLCLHMWPYLQHAIEMDILQ